MKTTLTWTRAAGIEVRTTARPGARPYGSATTTCAAAGSLRGGLTITFSLYNFSVMASRDELSRAFAALADPTRRTILERLGSGEAGVLELANGSPLTQPAITKHLKVLENAGLIVRSRDGQRRPARLQLEGLFPVDDWLRRAHSEWSERFDLLEAHLESQTAATNEDKEPGNV